MRKIIQKLAIKKKKFFVLLMALTTFLFYKSMNVFASPIDDLTDELGEEVLAGLSKIAEILYKNKRFFTQNTWIKDALRYIEWGIIKLLKWVADGCQGLYRKTIGMADFSSYQGLNDWINVIQVVCVAIMALSIAWYGIILILNHKKKNNILISVMLTGLCVSGLTNILINLNSAIQGFCNDTIQGNMSNAVISDNFYDLLYIDNNFGLINMDVTNSDNLVSYRYANGSVDIDAVDINEVINYDSQFISEEAQQILKRSVTFFNGYVPGEQHDFFMTQVYNGWGWNSGDDDDWFNEFYYRYHIEGFPIIISLIAISIIFICISYRTARVFIEIPLKRILALFYSHDITGTQKTMKILGSIKDSYIIVMVGAISIKLFYIWQQYLSEKCVDSQFAYCMLLLFGAFTLIDGPVLVQALTGEDAGLQTGAQRLMSAYQGARGVGRTVERTGAGITSAIIGHHRYKKMKDMLSGKDDKSKTRDGKKNIPDGKDSNGSNEDILKDIGKDKTQDEASNPKDISQEKGEKDNHNKDIQDGNLDGQEERDIEEGEEKKENALNEFDPSGEEKRYTNDDLREAINDEIEKENSYEKEEDVGNEKNRQIDNLPETDLTKDAGSKNKDILKNIEKDRTKDSNLDGIEKRDIGKDRIQNEFSTSKDILQEKVEKDSLNKEFRDGNLDGLKKRDIGKGRIQDGNLDGIEKRDIGESKSKKPIIDGKENLN